VGAEVLIPEGEDSIIDSFWGAPSILEHGGRLYVRYQRGGPSVVRAFTLDGAPAPAPEQPAVANVADLTPDGDALLFGAGSYLEPWAWWRYDPAAETTARTALFDAPPVDLSDCEVVREFATSADGARVPVNIVLPPGAPRDGSGAIVVTGYGGYGVSLSPRYRALDHLLLSRGVATAVVNLRGGGEYGEAWHLEGNLTKKQNVFDDFHAALNHVVEAGYASPERVGIVGGSNGGLLMGALFTQHPSQAAVVVSRVGIYDMLRVERSPNGAFNVTEFGTVQDEGQFRALHAYSPYHNVRDGVAFPPILFTTGANDPRVDPMQSRKMTARLQAATTGGPVLLRTSSDGHGGGTPLEERVAQKTDIYAFLLAALVGGD